MDEYGPVAEPHRFGDLLPLERGAVTLARRFRERTPMNFPPIRSNPALEAHWMSPALRLAGAGLPRGEHGRRLAARDGEEPQDLPGGDAQRGDAAPHLGREPPFRARGQPETGAGLADDLERFCDTYGSTIIAAVFVEPVAGSARGLVRRRRLWSGCAQSATGTASSSSSTIPGFGVSANHSPQRPSG